MKHFHIFSDNRTMAIPAIGSYPLPTPDSFPKNKASWTLQPARAALLVHDMQQYFLRFYEPDSALLKTLIGNIAALKRWAARHGVPVFYTAQPHQQPAGDRALLNDMWGPGLPAADAAQQAIVPEIAPSAGDVVLDKWRYSAFQRSDLAERLKAQQRDQLVIVGVYAHIGCMITAVEAFMKDIQPFLVGDAVADFSEAEHRMALQYVATRAGVVLATQDIITSTKN